MSGSLARDVERLVALFKAGGWSEVRVEGGGVSLLLSTDSATTRLGEEQDATVSSAPSAPRAAAAAAPAPAAAARPTAMLAEAVDPAWHAVRAPNIGTFYRSPKPGSPPFVEVGARIAADNELCLLEVMKLFTSVKAGVAGTVAHIAAADAELVTGGQPLFYIDPD